MSSTIDLEWDDDGELWLAHRVSGPAGSASIAFGEVVLDFDRMTPGLLTRAVIPLEPGPDGERVVGRLLPGTWPDAGAEPTSRPAVPVNDELALQLARVANLAMDLRLLRAEGRREMTQLEAQLCKLELVLAVISARSIDVTIAASLARVASTVEDFNTVGSLQAVVDTLDDDSLRGRREPFVAVVGSLIGQLLDVVGDGDAAHLLDDSEKRILYDGLLAKHHIEPTSQGLEAFEVLEPPARPTALALSSTFWHEPDGRAPRPIRATFDPPKLEEAFDGDVEVRVEPARIFVDGVLEEMPAASLWVEVRRGTGPHEAIGLPVRHDAASGGWVVRGTVVESTPEVRICSAVQDTQRDVWDFRDDARAAGAQAFEQERRAGTTKYDRIAKIWKQCALQWRAAGSMERSESALDRASILMAGKLPPDPGPHAFRTWMRPLESARFTAMHEHAYTRS